MPKADHQWVSAPTMLTDDLCGYGFCTFKHEEHPRGGCTFCRDPLCDGCLPDDEAIYDDEEYPNLSAQLRAERAAANAPLKSGGESAFS